MARRSFLDLQFNLQFNNVLSKEQPFTLQHLCRKIIIIHIIKSAGLFNVHKACAKLPIPKIVVNYLTNSSTKDEHFDIRTLGSLVELGYSGKCLLYGELVTLKCIDLRRKMGRLRTEAIRFKEKWTGIDHENISKAIVCFEENDIMGAIFEPCPPTIKDIVTQYSNMNEKIEEKNIWRVVRQLCSALMYLNKHKIRHHKLCSRMISVTNSWDVRVQNLLMYYSINESLTPLQELYYGVYLAPERIEGRSCEDKQDTWFIGCIAYEMVYRETAFRGSEGTSLFETLNNIVEGRPPHRLSDPDGYSNDLVNLIRSSLTHSEELRPSLEQVYQIIEDKFNSQK